MRTRTALAGAVIAVLVVPSAAAAALYGRVAAPRVITLKRADGTNVTHLSPGTKTFVIRDRSSRHNFHSKGPGVNRETGVAFVGRRKWGGLSLTNGTYTFLCDVHPGTMTRTFTVG
jgi:hypothetical protein